MLASYKSESEGGPLVVKKFWLIIAGIYLWEFVTTLDFEWNVIRGRQRYRWTIWIYIVLRLSGLVVTIILVINHYNTTPINCQAWVSSGWTFAAMGGYGLSSLLIMLRIFAIWDRSKVIMAIPTTVWVINLGLQLVGSIKIRAEWAPAVKYCVITNIEISRRYYLVLIQFTTDVILLFLMLVGLLRLRRGQGSFYIWRLLWKQGVIWLIIAISVELPLVVLVFLHVNNSLNLLPLEPAAAAIIIAATRMYRSLMMHSTSSSNIYLEEPNAASLQNTELFPATSHSKDSSAVHIYTLEPIGGNGAQDLPEPRFPQPVVPQLRDAQVTDKPHKTLGLDVDVVEGSDEI